MRKLTWVSALAVALVPSLFPASCAAQIAVPLTIPLPLEVRSPYLNFWMLAPSWSENTTTSTEFFFAEAFAGRTALLRIDGVTHSIFGQLALANRSNIIGSFITPTRTVFTLEIGPVEVSVTFLSPIEPYDWVRQSIPFAYISFDLNVTDGKTHDIQIYTHVQSGVFAAAVQNMTWSTVSTSQSVFEMAQLKNSQPLSENAYGQAEWGQFYYATARSDAVTFGVDSVNSLIRNFSDKGSLRTIPATGSLVQGLSNVTTAFAFSRNLGVVAQNATTVFAFGFIQDPAVQFADPNGQPQLRVPYFKTKYSSVPDLIDDFIGDYLAASSRSLGLEAKIVKDTARYPHDRYSILLSLVTRLVFASTVLTVAETPEGTLNSTDVMMFMKNIGAASATKNRVNPVEVLYAAFPMFLYFNPDLGGLLLEPLLRYQAWPDVTPPYAARDAGTSYPNISLPGENHDQGIEQTANMLLMIYAHARTSGDVTLIQKHISRMNNWTEYLIGSTLHTAQQESASFLSIYNQTNLAIKGIIAIKAMSAMSNVAGQSTTYSTVADAYYAQWKSKALAPDNHLLIQYGNESSWSLGENMFADMWLQTGLISQEIFTAHVNFLKTVNTTVAPNISTLAEFGIPLDSLRTNNVTYSSNMFAAGFGDAELQWIIFSGMLSHPLGEDIAFVDNTLTTWSPSPDLGSAYAPLILNVPLLDIVQNASARRVGGSSTNRKLGIAFGSIIGVAFLAGLLTLLCLIFYHRRRPWARARGAQAWEQQLGLGNLRESRRSSSGSRRDTNDVVSNDIAGPASSDSFTGPGSTTPGFAISPLESMRGRRDANTKWGGWRNPDDYVGLAD